MRLLITWTILVLCIPLFPDKVHGDQSLQMIQRKCKEQYDSFENKKMNNQESCPDYKKLVKCIAAVNFTAVNNFLTTQKPMDCDFSTEEIKDLQKYDMVSTTVSDTSTAAAGSMKMNKRLLGFAAVLSSMVLILQCSHFIPS